MLDADSERPGKKRHPLRGVVAPVIKAPEGDLMLRALFFGAVEVGRRLLMPLPPLAYRALERTQARHLVAAARLKGCVDIRYRSR